jgi:hypothetical protein
MKHNTTCQPLSQSIITPILKKTPGKRMMLNHKDEDWKPHDTSGMAIPGSRWYICNLGLQQVSSNAHAVVRHVVLGELVGRATSLILRTLQGKHSTVKPILLARAFPVPGQHKHKSHIRLGLRHVDDIGWPVQKASIAKPAMS